MTVQEFVKAVGAALGKSASAIYKAIMNAKLSALIRFGIVIGVSVVTVIAIFRYLKMKKHVFTDKSKKSVVDEALELNYADVRNQSELHPVMKKVRKNLTKELKPRKKHHSSKKAQKERKKYQNVIKNLNIPEYHSSRNDDYDVLDELEMFRREMRDIDIIRNQERNIPRGKEHYNLRNVWEFGW
jgi:hypothetical protein